MEAALMYVVPEALRNLNMNRLKLLGGRIPAPTMVIVLLSLAKGFMHIIPFYSQFIIIYTLHRGKLKPKEGKETAQGHSG